MSIVVYPLDNIDFSAEDVGIYNATRTSGIYAGDDFALSVTGANNIVNVAAGLGWMRLRKFYGVAVASKSSVSIDMGLPDSAYPRIDAVVLQFDVNKNGAEIVAKKGVASSSPQPPALSQTESLYELHLAHVRREPGATSVSLANVTDLRFDPNYCGLMADAVTQIDTTGVAAQIHALIDSLRQEIDAVKDGSAYLMRSGGTMAGPLNVLSPTSNRHAASKVYVDEQNEKGKQYVDSKKIRQTVILSSIGWVANAQMVSVNGVTADETKSDVIPSPGTADENYAAYLECGVRISAQHNGAVTFKCDSVPTRDLTVNIMVLT